MTPRPKASAFPPAEKTWRSHTRDCHRKRSERIHKLDDIIQRLYEDNIEGKISDERFFARMSENYEAGQKTLECRVAELRTQIAAQQESSVNIDRFLALVRRYTDIRELAPEIISEFVDRIEIYKPEQIGGHRVQRMRIVWNCIGDFMPPQKDEKRHSRIYYDYADISGIIKSLSCTAFRGIFKFMCLSGPQSCNLSTG